MKQPEQPFIIKRLNVPVTADMPIYPIGGLHSRPEKHIVYDMHFALELGIVLRGRMERRCRQQKEILEPGQIWLCGVWEPHGCRIVTAPCEITGFVIWPAALAEMTCPEAPCFNWMAPFTADLKERPRVPDSSRPLVINIGKRITALLKTLTRHGADGTPEINERTRLKLRVCLMDALLALTEKWEPPEANSPQSSALYDRINRAVDLVFHQHRFITADEAAKACHMPHDAFCEAFRKVMGLNFGDFVLSYRLDSARNQLLTTSDPIKKISQDWGFVDHSHFHHAFARHYGCPPAAYKKKIYNSPAK